MKKFLFLLLCSIFFKYLSAQNQISRNTIDVEAGGNGLFGSVNYEWHLTKKPGFGVHVGAGFYTENAFYLTLPVGINYLFKLRNNQSFLEVGLGVTWARFNGSLQDNIFYARGTHFTSFVPSFGYRKQTKNNLMYRFSLTPVINNYGFVPWAGISFGKSF